MYSWFEKYSILNSNYSEEIKNILKDEETMKISNHVVYNFTGRKMKLFRLFKSHRNNVPDDIKLLDHLNNGKIKFKLKLKLN